MPNLPCDNYSLCTDPANPSTNYSSEAPDNLTYIGINYPWIDGNNPVGGNNPADPPVWFAGGCVSICESSISQADANLCAGRQAFICGHTDGNGNTPTFFFSNLQACSVTCPDGSIFTFRALPGSFVNTSQAAADDQAAAFACAGAGFYQMCLSNIPGGCFGEAYSTTITTSHTPNPPYTFAIIAGSLPPGLSFAQGTNNATISGTPTASGNYTFTVQVTDQSGNTMQRTYTLGVLQITNSPPGATQNSAYSFQFTVNGGIPPYTFQLEGSLPVGLSMNSSGLISGTPTGVETDNFTITVSDSSA